RTIRSRVGSILGLLFSAAQPTCHNQWQCSCGPSHLAVRRPRVYSHALIPMLLQHLREPSPLYAERLRGILPSETQTPWTAVLDRRQKQPFDPAEPFRFSLLLAQSTLLSSAKIYLSPR